MRKSLSLVLAAVSGVIVAVVFVFVQGILAIQKIGMQAGVFMDPWTNSVSWVTGPRQPLLPMAGMGVLGALVALTLVFGFGRRSGRPHAVFNLGFLVAALVLVFWGLLSAPIFSAVEALKEGLAAGPTGWVEAAGTDSGVHLLVFFALAMLIMNGRRDTSNEVG